MDNAMKKLAESSDLAVQGDGSAKPCTPVQFRAWPPPTSPANIDGSRLSAISAQDESAESAESNVDLSRHKGRHRPVGAQAPAAQLHGVDVDTFDQVLKHFLSTPPAGWSPDTDPDTAPYIGADDPLLARLRAGAR